MTENIFVKKSLLTLSPFSEEQLNSFLARLVYRTIPKNGFLIRPNQIADGISFVVSGCFRQFTKSDDSELTINLFLEQSWITDIDSLLTQSACVNYIQAVEESQVASISLASIHELIDLYPIFLRLNGLISELGVSTRRVLDLATKSPDQRYSELLLAHPDWIVRFPQKYIASYLSMTPETLSRVRGRL